jgi:hypothetical protein
MLAPLSVQFGDLFVADGMSVSGFYIGLAVKAALIPMWAAWKEKRSLALLERSHRARRAKGGKPLVNEVPATNERIRTVQGEVL